MKKTLLVAWLLGFVSLIESTLCLKGTVVVSEQSSAALSEIFKLVSFVCTFAFMLIISYVLIMEYLGKVKRKENSWLIVTDKTKWSLWILLVIPLGLCKIVFLDLGLATENEPNISDVMLTIFLMVVGWYLFVRLNTYSSFYNPDHPRPKNNKK